MTTDSIQTPAAGMPRSGVNLHQDEILLDPYPTYAELRETGPVVWLDTYNMYALPRYAEVIAVLNDPATFTSTQGVGFNEYFNSIRETSLMTDGEHHAEIRRIEGGPLRPRPLRELTPRLREFAEKLVADVVERKSFDAVPEFARKMPLEIISELVGMEGVGPERLFQWGVAGFDSIGPLWANRTQDALQTMAGYFEWAAENVPGCIRKGSWADQVFVNGKETGWTEEFCRGVMNDYIYPSVDSTINSIAAGVLYFGQNPDQWQMLRENRALMDSAVPEIVRLAAPLQFFTRAVTTDTQIAGVTIPKDSRVLVMFGSANRDGRQFPDPDKLDITRDPRQHVGWGWGLHACLGKPVAQMEMATLFDVLADHVERIEIHDFEYKPNNIIRGLGRLQVTVTKSP